MSKDYLCPACKAYLNVEENIVLTVKTPAKTKGVILLDTEIGNYKVKKNKRFEIADGDVLGLFCPVCHEDLSVNEFGDHFAKVLMVDEELNEFNIYFSQVFGEHCTYKVFDNEIETFGEDSEKYVNFFGEMPKY